MSRWIVGICLFGLLAVGTARESLAGDPHFDAGQKLFGEGRSLMNARKYPDARAKFEASIKEYEQVAAADRNKRSAENNIKAARQNIVCAYDHDAFGKLKDGDKSFEQKSYDKAAESYAASVKAYELAEKMTKRNYKEHLKYARDRAAASKGLGAIAAKAPAPDFSLTDLSGAPVKLSDHKGKVVLLDFWAVWCNPCRELVPMLDKLYQDYKDGGFVVLGLSMDKTEGYNRRSAGKVGTFVKENIHYPVLWATDEVRCAYGDIPSVPTVILLDRNGCFYRRYAHDEATEENLKNDIGKLLEK